MKDTLLTQRQMEILRLRKQGYTQQWIAEKLGTSKANICAIEKSANENIRRAKETLNFLYTLDASELCTLEAGTDLITAPTKIYSAAGLLHIKIKYDTISLITRISATVPEKLKGRQVKENITIYANQDGNLYIE